MIKDDSQYQESFFEFFETLLHPYNKQLYCQNINNNTSSMGDYQLTLHDQQNDHLSYDSTIIVTLFTTIRFNFIVNALLLHD